MAGKWPQLWVASNAGPLDCPRGWLTFPGNPEAVAWLPASSCSANGLARGGPEARSLSHRCPPLASALGTAPTPRTSTLKGATQG